MGKVCGIWLLLVGNHRRNNYFDIKSPKYLPWLLNDDFYLIQKISFSYTYMGSEKHLCWVCKLVNIKRKFNYNKNLNDGKNSKILKNKLKNNQNFDLSRQAN